MLNVSLQCTVRGGGGGGGALKYCTTTTAVTQSLCHFETLLSRNGVLSFSSTQISLALYTPICRESGDIAMMNNR
jgi:hypothetical protein